MTDLERAEMEKHEQNWNAWLYQGDVVAGLRWITSPITCNSERVKAIAAAALKEIEEWRSNDGNERC
jgi:hypothetical protein